MTKLFSRLYGLTIASPFPLPGAEPLSDLAEPADVTIAWEPETEWRTIVDPLAFGSAAEFGQPRAGFAADGSLCLEWLRELQFAIAPANDAITVVCRRAKLEYAPTALVGVGLGLLLHRRGVLCLHGSAVSVNGSILALLGDSGAGKSTLAAALVARGATLIADDLVALRAGRGRHFVARGCTNLRLHESAKRQIVGDRDLATAPWVGKLLWDVAADTAAATALDAIYVLGSAVDDARASIGPPLSAFDAFRELLAAWYPPGFTSLLTQQRLDDVRKVAAEVPVSMLRYPRQWELLPEVVGLLAR